MNEEHPIEPRTDAPFERIGECLYRKGGKIVARVRINGKASWRSTGTDDPKLARKWLRQWRTETFFAKSGMELPAVALHRERLTVGELMDAYIAAGCPTRKMHEKLPSTISKELSFCKPLRAYFGGKSAAALTLADADRYFEWRKSGGYVSEYKLRGKPKVKRTKGGRRIVDMELGVLSNVFNLGVRRGQLKANPLASRGRYTTAAEIRHCRECAPTPENLQKIEGWLRERGQQVVADAVCFMAYSGLRVGEALPLDWEAVNWGEKLLHVVREKRGIMPWVPILPEMEMLLRQMKARALSHLLFPSPFDTSKPREASVVRRRITAACKSLGIGHVTPHGLRSYFVTQARQSGLTDAEVAMLIGDKSGPTLIASTYGDVRPDHLLAQAQRIRLTASSIKRSIELPITHANSPALVAVSAVAEAAANQGQNEIQ